MAIELSRLYEEVRTYRIPGVPNSYILRREYRDLSISSFKWNLCVSRLDFSDSSPVEHKETFFSCKNYTRSTNQRRFKEFMEKCGYTNIELARIEQFFLKKEQFDV